MPRYKEITGDMFMPEDIPDMIKQVAQKKISALTAESMKLLREAEAVADQYGLSFDFDPAYGMGGYYNPNSGWNASSQSC